MIASLAVGAFNHAAVVSKTKRSCRHSNVSTLTEQTSSQSQDNGIEIFIHVSSYKPDSSIHSKSSFARPATCRQSTVTDAPRSLIKHYKPTVSELMTTEQHRSRAQAFALVRRGPSRTVTVLWSQVGLDHFHMPVAFFCQDPPPRFRVVCLKTMVSTHMPHATGSSDARKGVRKRNFYDCL